MSAPDGFDPILDDEAGAVGWVECGGRAADDLLAEVQQLTAALGGEFTLVEREPGYAVAMTALPAASVQQFKGGLSLAGATFAPGRGGADRILVFILANETAGAAQP